jgi:Extensin-like protein C-terminus
MARGVRLYLVGSVVLVSLAGCGRGFFQSAEREPWRAEAEIACMKSGAVKESAEVVRIEPISGPGMCGAEFPLKVAALGEASSMYGFADDDLRPPAPIGNQPRWPIQQTPPPAYPQNPYPQNSYPPAQSSYPPYPPPSNIPRSPSPQTAVRQPNYAAPSAPISLAAPGVGERQDDEINLPSEGAPSRGAITRAPYPAPSAYPQNPSPQSSYPPRDGAPYSPRTDIPPGTPQRLGPGPVQGDPVSSFGSVALRPAATLACPIVSVLDRWISDSVQPAAQRWFGARVVEIRQISAYSCRGMNGNPNAHISEHAFGNALDIAAFTLADGRRINVKDGWHGLPEEQGFLRDVQGAACQQFNTVLAPGSNQYHYDHIHVDLMRRASGRIICEPAAVSGEQIAARAQGRNPYPSSRDSYVTGSLGGRAHKHKSATAKVNEEDEFEDD